MLDDLRMAVRFARDLRAFLGRPYTTQDCRRLLKDQLARRDQSFLRIMARAVFGNARSPYFALMHHAKVQYSDVAAWVRRQGVEGALAELYGAGVHVTLDEFKGRRPVRRPGLELPVRDHDFDNPLLTAHYEGRSGGTRGVGTRTRVDLGLLAHEAASDLIALTALDALGRPMGIWRPAVPAGAAMKSVLRHARVGILAERWFSQNEFKFSRDLWRHWLFTRYSVAISRRWRRPFPMPEYTPLAQAIVVARWLAQKKAQGTPGYLDVAVSSAVRVCLAARQHGLDIAGTFFRVGSEPFTEARARIIAEAGCGALCHYHLAEVGRLGVACTAPAAVDEVHVVTDSVVLLQRERSVGGATVGALFCSTLHPAVPKVMVNVELGDYGVLSERACGCPFDHLGFRQHLHTIRSYEKLTSEGMHFVGSELLRLVEEELPDRFGGHPTDYQLLEEEEGGLSKVSLLVSPRVGEIDEAQVVSTALEVLGSVAPSNGGAAMMAGYWRAARTLRVVRREPHATTGAKILPLHVIKQDDRESVEAPRGTCQAQGPGCAGEAGARKRDGFAEEFDFMARTTGGARYGLLLDHMPLRTDRALDAGCGTGLFTMRLAKRVRHVVGLDISRSMIAVAKKHQAEEEQHNVTFVSADLEALPFIERSFDFVVAASSVQRTHLKVALLGLRRLVKPGGRLALYVTVSSFPRLRDWRSVRVLMTIPGALGYLKSYGFRTMWRLIRFQTSRAWLRQGADIEFLRARREEVRDRALISARPVPTPDALREMCTRLLPGCRVERPYRWAMTVVWEAPEPDDPVEGSHPVIQDPDLITHPRSGRRDP